MDNCIGTDISENTSDTHSLAGSSDARIDYATENTYKTVNRFRSVRPELIVMEATGGYEVPLAEALHVAGLPVAVVSPKRIRDFAKAVGQTAETDRTDARVIARFGATLQPPATDAPDENVVRIRALTARKRQLTKMRTAEKNRTEHSRYEFTAQSIQTVTDTLNTQIAAVDGQVRTLIPSSPELRQKA